MTAVQAIIILVCVAVLVICSCIQLRRWESEFLKPRPLTGNSSAVAKLKPKLEHVRRNYLAARPPARGVCYHKALLGLARRAVVRLPYFRDREAEEHAKIHNP